jgi:hypothetical protein
VTQPPEELCWREHELLVVPPMSGRSKGKSQTKVIPWSFGLQGGSRAQTPSSEKCTVTKPPEHKEEAETHRAL